MKKFITLTILSLTILPIALFPGIAQARGFSHSSFHSSYHSSYHIKPVLQFTMHHTKIKKKKTYTFGGWYSLSNFN